MRLSKEEQQAKEINSIIEYVTKNGTSISDNEIYWNTYPICVQDVCVLGVKVKGKRTKQLIFGDMKGKKFIEIKDSKNVEAKYLKDALTDMKEADKKYKK